MLRHLTFGSRRPVSNSYSVDFFRASHALLGESSVVLTCTSCLGLSRNYFFFSASMDSKPLPCMTLRKRNLSECTKDFLASHKLFIADTNATSLSVRRSVLFGHSPGQNSQYMAAVSLSVRSRPTRLLTRALRDKAAQHRLPLRWTGWSVRFFGCRAYTNGHKRRNDAMRHKNCAIRPVADSATGRNGKS